MSVAKIIFLFLCKHTSEALVSLWTNCPERTAHGACEMFVHAMRRDSLLHVLPNERKFALGQSEKGSVVDMYAYTQRWCVLIH
jgi:hypothetical protein